MRFVVQLRHELELELDDAIFVGCSMGGHLAPDLALHYPGEFRAAVSVEGSIATHVDEPFLRYLHHPRVSNELKGALMYTMTSPSSPERFRRRPDGPTAKARRGSSRAISCTTSASTT
jgi:pimeloyl-ACP methyl ester carboxylesterase